VTFTQSLLERCMEFLRADVTLLEVLGHECLVHFHDLVDQRLVCFLHRGEIRFS
jgi:hypothetical protein